MKYPRIVPALFATLFLGFTTVSASRAVEIVAHRGESADAPENTLAACRLAWDRGVNAVEIDVHLTQDGKPIVIHDKGTKRTTGVHKIVSQSTLAELRTLDAGRWKGERWAGEQLPTLTEVLDLLPEQGRLFIEIKVGPEAVPAIEQSIRDSKKPLKQIVIISFNAATVAEAKRRLPGAEALLLAKFEQDKTTGKWSPTVDELIALVKTLGADGLDVGVQGPLDKHFIERVHAANLKLYVYTVNSFKQARELATWNIDGITCDNAAAQIKQLADGCRPDHADDLNQGASMPTGDASMTVSAVDAAREAEPRNQRPNHARSTSRPNVLFLAVDDLRDWVGCMDGYAGKVHTPNIDRLAKRGTLFTNAHCASPLCGPSRAAVMTGMLPSSTGVYNNSQWWLPHLPDVVPMPMHFRNHGYHVVGAGKIFHHTAGNNPPKLWDDFLRLTFRNDPWLRSDRLNYPWSETAPMPAGHPFNGVKGLLQVNDWGTLPISATDYDDVRTADYAIECLKQKHDKPFFLACGLFRPHLPWYVPKEYFDLYPIDDICLPRVRDDDLEDVPQPGRQLAHARQKDFHAIRDADRWRHAVQAYLASISFADAQIGRVLDALSTSPYSDNTIVVLWSDHGWHLGEKGHWHKSTLWEAATRVPLIIQAPGIAPGVCTRPVSLVDIYPTLVELCALEAIAAHDGTSIAKLLCDPSATWDRPAVIEFRRRNAAVRSERYRYIRYHDGSEELYDHELDPNEWNNLANDRTLAPVKTHLANWIAKQWAAPAPTKEAYSFDPDSFTWEHRKTGRQINGK